VLLLSACVNTGESSPPSIYKPFQNEPTGFRGIEWGTPLSAVQTEMIPYGDPPPGGGQVYERKNEKMTLGGATLAHVFYRFYEGGFSGADLFSVERADQPAAMIAAFRAEYGEGNRPNEYEDDYLWTDDVGSVFLHCNSITYECSALIASTAARQKEKDEKANAAEAGKKDF
jgi:hypothetical protein